MLNRTSIALAAVLATVLLAGCAGFKVTDDYDPSADFSQYGGYAWLPRPDPTEAAAVRPDDGLLRQRIERAVDESLSAKGLRRVESAADATLLVTEHISVEQKLRVNTTNYGYGYGRWGYYGGGYTDTTVDQYEEGTLILDFIDAKTKQLVWRGMAQSRLKEMSTPEEREARVRAAVAAILEKYPPKAK